MPRRGDDLYHKQAVRGFCFRQDITDKTRICAAAALFQRHLVRGDESGGVIIEVRPGARQIAISQAEARDRPAGPARHIKRIWRGSGQTRDARPSTRPNAVSPALNSAAPESRTRQSSSSIPASAKVWPAVRSCTANPTCAQPADEGVMSCTSDEPVFGVINADQTCRVSSGVISGPSSGPGDPVHKMSG